MRPAQWVKNLLVFAAPGAAGSLTEGGVAVRTIVAFVAFSLAASATYLLNDAGDVHADREHPTKKSRPIAAGELSVGAARVAAVCLGVIALALAAAVDQRLLLTILAYLAVTTAYSVKLKHIAIVDVLAVSFGFLLRAVAGGAATDVPLTGWFYLVVSSGALLLIVGKRVGELRSSHGGKATRPVLERYTLGTLQSLLAAASLSAICGYLLWSGVESSKLTTRSGLIWLSAIPFITATIRYAWLSEQGRGESPDKLVFKDPITLGSGVLWVILFGAAVYV